MKFFVIISFLILTGGRNLLAKDSPAIETKLDSSIIVVGEKTYLTVWVENLTLIDWPTTPKAAPLALKRETQRRYQINGRIREGFRYLVSAFEPGIYKIPPFELQTNSGVIRSKTHTL
ncbi:BatD family protein, partial [Akkermansiaceae bacterium]|nr:BatD family protein [Akkermansiaceae bacterium]